MIAPSVDSESVGDPNRFRPFSELVRGLEALPPAPPTRGRVEMIVCRGAAGLRETLARVRLTATSGVPGDKWGQRPHPKPEAQLSVMQRDVAELIANGQPLLLFGDNLFLDLDLSAASLPIGSRLRVGSTLMEVTPKPHNGCKKFDARFGNDALRFVSTPELRHRNLRGIYLRVIEVGEVAAGDLVEVLSRPST